MRLTGIEQVKSFIYYPQSNRRAECVVQLIIGSLRVFGLLKGELGGCVTKGLLGLD